VTESARHHDARGLAALLEDVLRGPPRVLPDSVAAALDALAAARSVHLAMRLQRDGDG
jgi:hypothetical protein